MSASAPRPPDLNDTASLKAFIDGAIREQMQANDVAGATIAIVKNGSILYAQGYGYADVENKTPVDANKTLFRIGSITKTFTATAVMQLKEEGKLDMNADVNTYLTDFKIPDTYSRPITMNNLLTHTAGFEARSLWTRDTLDEAKAMSPGEYVARDMPARARPPGEVISYSNYGTSLAGYIVQQVSGMPYDQYIERNILLPLGMNNSSASQPLPPGLEANMSKGYVYENGGFKEFGFEYINPAPAGSISSSATDMARFMIAQLNNGSYDNASILNASTAIDMHSQHFSNDPRIDGIGYAFLDGEYNGKWGYGHAGGTQVFFSWMVLLPSENVGIFISSNSLGGARMYIPVVSGFLDRYYPAPALDPPVPMAGYGERAPMYAGAYYNTESASTTNEKLFTNDLIGQFTVVANENGTIGTPWGTYVEVEPLYFKQLNGTGTLAFRQGDNGGIEYMFMNTNSFARAEWYQTFTFHLVLLALCLLAFLSALVAWPVKYLLDRRKKDGKKIAPGSIPSLAKCTSATVSALGIVFAVGMAYVIVRAISDNNYVVLQIPFEMYALLAIPIVTTVLAVVAVAFTLLAWKGRYWGLPERIHYTIVTVAMIAFTWLMYYWNLIGYRF